jgi:aryl-alcohol dehydrogenase-like predicted oxidoreductase
MDYKRLGRTGLRVSPLCLGTMNFGPHTSEEDAFAIMDRALELGVNSLDTVNSYRGGAPIIGPRTLKQLEHPYMPRRSV